MDSGLTATDYEILAVLSEHPAGRMPAQELCSLLQWEKSRLSHHLTRMVERGLVTREACPTDNRGTYVVQGKLITDEEAIAALVDVREDEFYVEIPKDLMRFAAEHE